MCPRSDSRRRLALVPAALVILTVLTPAPDGPASVPFGVSTAQAQAPEELGPPPMYAGGHVVIAQPQGEFADYVDLGIGVAGFFRVPLDESQFLSLRVDLAGMTYGSETRRVCLVLPCLVEVDLTTSNNILLGGIGPEIGLPLGQRARLYVNAGAGFSYFATTSRIDDDRDGDAIATTTNFSDFGFAWNGGGGLQFSVSRGEYPVAIDLGLSHQGNGMREYLTEGDIIVRDDGSVEFDAQRSEADLLLWRIGVSVGLRRNP